MKRSTSEKASRTMKKILTLSGTLKADRHFVLQFPLYCLPRFRSPRRSLLSGEDAPVPQPTFVSRRIKSFSTEISAACVECDQEYTHGCRANNAWLLGLAEPCDLPSAAKCDDTVFAGIPVFADLCILFRILSSLSSFPSRKRLLSSASRLFGRCPR